MRLRQVIPLKMGACWSVVPNKAARNPAKEVMTKLNEIIENIGKKEDHLQRKIDAELGNAKKFHTAGKKREALQCIKKKKMYEQQLATLGTSKINLENQKLTMEAMKMNAEILDAQRVAAKSMQEQVKQMGGVDKVEELMDEVEDAQTDAREIQEAMGRQLEVPGVGDGRAVEMPSAQKCGGKAGFHKQLRKRIMGVARPMMSQRAIINVVGSASLEAEHEDSMAYANRLVSIEVVNHEIERFKKAVGVNPRYVDVLEALVFKKEMIEMNVQCGMLSLPQYLDGLREAIAADKIRYKDKGDKVAGAHVVIMTKELKEAEENL